MSSQRTIKLLATAILEGAQGILETGGPACFGSEKDQGSLLGGDQAQGKKVASLAEGTGNRGGGGPGSIPEQILCARHWSRPWGMQQ